MVSSVQKLLWVTGGGGLTASPGFGVITGLARVIQRENSNLKITTLAVESRRSMWEYLKPIANALQMSINGSSTDAEVDYVEKAGLLHINRLIQALTIDRDMHAKMVAQLDSSFWAMSTSKDGCGEPRITGLYQIHRGHPT